MAEVNNLVEAITAFIGWLTEEYGLQREDVESMIAGVRKRRDPESVFYQVDIEIKNELADRLDLGPFYLVYDNGTIL